MSMLTVLKMSSLTCKCGFYRPGLNAKGWGPMELNFECLETNGESSKSNWEKMRLFI